jgi:hypothetical protein
VRSISPFRSCAPRHCWTSHRASFSEGAPPCQSVVCSGRDLLPAIVRNDPCPENPPPAAVPLQRLNPVQVSFTLMFEKREVLVVDAIIEPFP